MHLLGVHGEHGVGVLLHGSNLHGSQREEDGNPDGRSVHLLGVHGEHGVGVLVLDGKAYHHLATGVPGAHPHHYANLYTKNQLLSEYNLRTVLFKALT